MSTPVWKFILLLCLQLFGPLYVQLKSILKKASCLEAFFANQPEKLRPCTGGMVSILLVDSQDDILPDDDALLTTIGLCRQ